MMNDHSHIWLKRMEIFPFLTVFFPMTKGNTEIKLIFFQSQSDCSFCLSESNSNRFKSPLKWISHAVKP